jgi:hypothetical protein
MKVYIEHDPPARLVRVYITQQDRFLIPPDQWIPYEPGTRPDSYMTFDVSIWDAVMKEACGSRTSDDDALKDTRQVRDRLFNMVEAVWGK